ncbi:hypothetical protein AVEN_131047-1 [Araneus ventricosus]|uniref:Uncharacterized protein n=1 Tax=Araneus ventricosus TaxID=182803 RepID=A0A4Y2H3F7_ARAVE|nr:hypothetical protein AVEN_131047-1 [Araneus ventricosus]
MHKPDILQASNEESLCRNILDIGQVGLSHGEDRVWFENASTEEDHLSSLGLGIMLGYRDRRGYQRLLNQNQENRKINLNSLNQEGRPYLQENETEHGDIDSICFAILKMLRFDPENKVNHGISAGPA